MCANNNLLGNNINSCNNPNMLNGNVGLVIENGNNSVLSANTNPFNNVDVLNSNSFNNNSCGCNCNGNNSCACNNNNSCGCNCNSNNSCGCSNNDNTATLGDNISSNSLQENLRNFIGRRVTLEFNICGECSKKTGILSCVGCNFVTLRGVNNNNCLLADTNGLTFVTVHNC